MKWQDFNDADDITINSENISTEDIKNQLLSRLESVLTFILPAGKFYRNHFVIGDVKGNKGDSLKVELSNDKAGMWHDFATGDGGDIFDLWASCNNLNIITQFPEVINSIKEWLGTSKTTQKPYSISAETVPKLKNIAQDDLGSPTAKWDYTDSEGKLIACIYRYDTKIGKQFRPWDVKARKHKAPNPRPLYNQHGIKINQHVILVEGEKAAEALINQGFCATTAMNGAKAPIEKTDWAPLGGKHLLIWPDQDKAGRNYGKSVAAYLSGKLLASLTILQIPDTYPEKWDAADAVVGGLDIKYFIKSVAKTVYQTEKLMPAYSVGHMLDDESPMPEDLISPRVLTPAGLLVFGGAPKVGKSDFLLSLLSHMASGIDFLGMKPARPLRIFYLQAEIGYHYLRERLKNMAFDKNFMPLIRKNLVVTPQFKMLLNEDGVEDTSKAIAHHFPDNTVDIIVIDPLRNVFDGGISDASENDNAAMLFFLQKRLDILRDKINPDAGIILAHHTKKLEKKKIEEDPFQALSGAGSLRGYYSSGVIMFQPDENNTARQIIFELRNGPKLKSKLIDKINGSWQELDCYSNRLINKNYGQKLDAERRRKRDVILQLIYEEARSGRIYTMNQFCQAFENKAGLGGKDTVRGRLDVLSTNGYIKFFRDTESYGIPKASRTKYGFLCVEGMSFAIGKNIIDQQTGSITDNLHPVYPTHYKCRQTAAVLPVENPRVWVYFDEEVT